MWAASDPTFHLFFFPILFYHLLWQCRHLTFALQALEGHIVVCSPLSPGSFPMLNPVSQESDSKSTFPCLFAFTFPLLGQTPSSSTPWLLLCPWPYTLANSCKSLGENSFLCHQARPVPVSVMLGCNCSYRPASPEGQLTGERVLPCRERGLQCLPAQGKSSS